MAVEFKRTPDDLQVELTNLATQHGFTRLDRFIGSFVDTVVNYFGGLYNETYSLDEQTRIDTATAEYLDSWGALLDEPRTISQDLQDLSLDNVYIYTSNDQPVSRYTVGGSGLLIPNGTRILDDSGIPILSLVDTILMDGGRRFVRVVSPSVASDSVPSGTYRLDGKISTFTTARLQGEQTATALLEIPDLLVNVQRPIEGSGVALSDLDYRFVLYSKSRSINLANKERVDVRLGDTRIARFIIEEFSSGSSSVTIYIEPVTGLLEKPLEQAMKAILRAVMPWGTVIHVARMIGNPTSINVDVTLTASTNVAQRNAKIAAVSTAIINYVLNLGSAAIFSMTDLASAIQGVAGIADKQIKKVMIGGKRLYADRYEMRDIEYLYTSEQLVTVNMVDSIVSGARLVVI